MERTRGRGTNGLRARKRLPTGKIPPLAPGPQRSVPPDGPSSRPAADFSGDGNDDDDRDADSGSDAQDRRQEEDDDQREPTRRRCAAQTPPPGRYPRLQTLGAVVERHVAAMREGDFVARSQRRWRAFSDADPAAESDATAAHRQCRESAALVIQSVWRRSAAVRVRMRLVRGIWQHQMDVAAWIARDLGHLRGLVDTLRHSDDYSGDNVISLRALDARFRADPGPRLRTLRGLYYDLPAMLISARMRYATARGRAAFLRRPPTILQTVDVPVWRTCRALAAIWRCVTTRAVTLLQCQSRSFAARRSYRGLLRRHHQRVAATRLQCAYRASVARRHVHHLRCRRAAIRIQCAYRRHLAQARVQRARVHRFARTFVTGVGLRGVEQCAVIIVHRSAVYVQKVFRGKRARAEFRRLLGQHQQAMWRRNPSKGYLFFERGLYPQAAVHLEQCVRQGIFQSGPSCERPGMCQHQQGPEYTGTKPTFSFTAPSTFLSAPYAPGQQENDAILARLQFWQVYALSHMYTYEAVGDVVHLRQARVGFETYLRLDSDVQDRDRTSSFRNDLELLRLHSHFRLVQCLHWGIYDRPSDRSRVMEASIELVDELETAGGLMVGEMTERRLMWETQLHLLNSALLLEMGEIEQSIQAISRLPVGDLSTKFAKAIMLLELDAKKYKAVGGVNEFREPSDFSDEAMAAEDILRHIFQFVELEPSVGFYHGVLSTEQAMSLLVQAQIGAFLLHRDDNSGVSSDSSSYFILKVKLAEDPLKVSSLRITFDHGVYRTKKLPHCSHFSVHGLLSDLPPAAAVRMELGIRKPLLKQSIVAKLPRDQLLQFHRKVANRCLALDWDGWVNRIRRNNPHNRLRNETWSAVCHMMAVWLEASDLLQLGGFVARDGLAFSRDRGRRADLCFLLGRTLASMHRGLDSAMMMQQAALEATRLPHRDRFDVNFIAVKRALSRNVGISQREAFSSQLERLSKLERMCCKAWEFDSLSSSYHGHPFREALLLQRIDDEMFFECGDTYFLRSLLRSHIRAFLLTGKYEYLHLDKALSCVPRLLSRFLAGQGLHHHDTFLRHFRSHLLRCQESTDQPHRSFSQHILLVSWRGMPFQVCFEIAEAYYRSPASATDQLVETYESLYGRLRGSKPRSWAHAASEELILYRLAFLNAQKAIRNDPASWKRAIEVLDELLGLRRMRMLGDRQRGVNAGNIRPISWPMDLKFPLKFSLTELMFTRGFLVQLRDISQGNPKRRKKYWRDFAELHQELLDLVVREQQRMDEYEGRANRRVQKLKGIRVYVGETKDVDIPNILQSRPFVTVQCDGRVAQTVHPPVWTNLAPSWDEYVEIDVDSSKARLIVTLRNRSRRFDGRGDLVIGSVQVFVEDLISNPKFEKPQRFILIAPEGNRRSQQITLSFQISFKHIERSNNNASRPHRVTRGNWDVGDVQQHLRGDLQGFVTSRWIWSRVGRLWLADKDFFLASWWLQRAVEYGFGNGTHHDPIDVSNDYIGLAVCYQATMGESWSAYVEPLLNRAFDGLREYYEAGGSIDIQQWRQLEKISKYQELLSESVIGPLEGELIKRIPASSHWVRMKQRLETTRSNYFNQDTATSFAGVLGDPQLSEPLEYEDFAAIIMVQEKATPRRILVMTTEMRSRVTYHCTEQQRLHAADPCQWVAVFNVRKGIVQFFSHQQADMQSTTKRPQSYAMVVDEYVMYHVLLVQDAFRRYHRRVRQHRRIRGLMRTACWFAQELAAARRRLFERAEAHRKAGLNMLHVVVERATGLRAMDVLSSDPFVIVELVDCAGRVVSKGQTSVKKNTLQPKWHEEFEFHYDFPSHDREYLRPLSRAYEDGIKDIALRAPSLRLHVYDFDLIPGSKDEIPVDILDDVSVVNRSRWQEKNDFLGLACVDISPLDHGRCVSADLILRDEDGYESPRPRGVLTVIVHWKHATNLTALRRNALTPSVIVRPRKRPRSKPKLEAEDLAMQKSCADSIVAVVSVMTEISTFLDQLVKLYRRYLVAVAVGKTAEEAKLLEQRLCAIMTSQFESKRFDLVHRVAHTQGSVAAFYNKILPSIEEYIDGCDHDVAEEHKTSLLAFSEALLQQSITYSQVASTPSPNDGSPQSYQIKRFVDDMNSVLGARVAVLKWSQAFPKLLSLFFANSPPWSETPNERASLEHFERLAGLIGEHSIGQDQITVSRPSSRAGPIAPSVLTAVSTASIPGVMAPAAQAMALPSQALTKRLERIEREKRRKNKTSGGERHGGK